MIVIEELEAIVRHLFVAVILLSFLAGCTIFRVPMAPNPEHNLFVLFFVPGTTRLTPEAEQIVRQAADSALKRPRSKIEVAIPTDTPGGVPLVEGRITAIQNILSAARVDLKRLAPAALSDDAARLPGGADRAEVRLTQ